jgi:hypothetical protein
MTTRTILTECSRRSARTFPFRQRRLPSRVVNVGIANGRVWWRALILIVSCITFFAVLAQVIVLAYTHSPKVYSAQAIADMVEPTPPAPEKPSAPATNSGADAQSSHRSSPRMPSLCAAPEPNSGGTDAC